MKCIILAGGKGERLWPLSRANYPKQFIRIKDNHSVFQETVARNIPFCDEFIIVTGSSYRDIIYNQMKVFQGVSYSIILEDIPRRTLTSVLLASLDLSQSEFVFAVASDLVIGSSEEYREAIIRAKTEASQGKIAALCMEETEFSGRYGYISEEDGKYSFKEKPETMPSGKLYRNLGMILFRAGDFIYEAQKLEPDHLKNCKKAYKKSVRQGNERIYSEELLSGIEPLSVERSVLEHTDLLAPVMSDFDWKELTSLEDIPELGFKNEGVVVVRGCYDSVVINDSRTRALVVDGVSDAVVVNTDDAVYVGRKKKGAPDDIKSILNDEPSLKPFLAKSIKYYRHWGYYEQLAEGINYHIRRVTVLPGKTIFSHSHDNKVENWTIIEGKAVVSIGGKTELISKETNINIPVGVMHRISNAGSEPLVFVDTSYGDALHEEELLPRKKTDEKIGELDLGVREEPLIKLKPSFRDCIWGGTMLRDEYEMDCDYDRIGEAWLMSAHPAGESVVNSGRHKGMKLSQYIETVGRKILGWKCEPLKAFPLLVKFIDARDSLSLQVHPDDDYAMEKEGEYGKNEMWYVISAEEGAGLYIGFKRDVTPEEVRARIADGTLAELLNFFPTKPGDVFFIPAGTVHAVGAGNLLCEIQQSSDCTYRLYDFDRVDKYGNKRELMIDKGLDVARLGKYQAPILKDDDDDDEVICKCKYFESSIYDVDGQMSIVPDSSMFNCLICVEGQGKVGTLSGMEEALDIKAGECIFNCASEEVIKFEGKMKIIVVHI